MALEFKVGGPVHYQSSVYVTRQIERKILQAVQRRDYATIIGPRQVGKTSLLQKIQAITIEQGQIAILIDMSTINIGQAKPDSWYANFTAILSNSINKVLDQEIKIIPPGDGGQFIQFWEALSSQVSENNILILIDEASSIPEYIRDAFYSTIRWIFTDRTAYHSSKNLKKLNFIFAGVFEPERLIESRENSPFNISKIFRLPDFSKKENRQLFQLIEKELSIDIPDEALDKVFEYTYGHPYLSQAIAAALYDELSDNPKFKLKPDSVTRIIKQGLQDSSDNIEHIGKTVMKYRSEFYEESQREKSNQVFVLDSLIKNEIIPFTRALRQISKLELLGAIKNGENDECQFRNKEIENTFRKLITFNIKPEDNPIDVNKTLKEEIQRVRGLIGTNQINLAFTAIEDNLLTVLPETFHKGEGFRNEIIQLKRRYLEITGRDTSGLVSQDQAGNEVNRIVHSILTLLDSLSKMSS